MAVAKTASQAEVREELERLDGLKRRAARQNLRERATEVALPTVEVLVLPLGDGKISMGEHIASLGDAFYEEGEKLTVELPKAVRLYELGYVNFEAAKEAALEARNARQRAAQAAYDRMDPDLRSALYTGQQ